MGIEVQEFLHQREGVTGLEYFFFVFNLILPVGLDTTRQIDLVAFTQVEQRSRRNRQHQLVVYGLWHPLPPPVDRLKYYVDR
ncbi:hypothetical protein D3C76_1502500 [compost metagenome]